MLLGDTVHPVDVCLAELSTMGVDRKLASEFDCATGDEVLGLSPTAETEFLQAASEHRA